PGSYNAAVTWVPFGSLSPTATYKVFDGGTLLGTVTVNQQAAPSGPTVNGVVFQSLGHFQINSGTLKVVLTQSSGGYVIADAVRVVASDLTFSGFGEADLNEGVASDTLALNTSVSTLAVKVLGNGGDDTFNVRHVGQSMFLQGDTGQDTVNVILPDSPANHADLLNLSFLVEHLNVDNTANPGAVSWQVDNGDT